MKVGVTLPLSDIGGGPATVQLFAEAAEAAPDHVLGLNVASWLGWGARNTSADLFHDIYEHCGFARGPAWSAGVGRSAARRYIPYSFEGGKDG